MDGMEINKSNQLFSRKLIIAKQLSTNTTLDRPLLLRQGGGGNIKVKKKLIFVKL